MKDLLLDVLYGLPVLAIIACIIAATMWALFSDAKWPKWLVFGTLALAFACAIGASLRAGH